jgi:hypothetical protein
VKRAYEVAGVTVTNIKLEQSLENISPAIFKCFNNSCLSGNLLPYEK